MAEKPPTLRCWPGPKGLAEARERRRRERQEVLSCAVCGRGFAGAVVLETPAQADAPEGLCRACQEDRIR